MMRNNREQEDTYEIIIRKCGQEDPVETDIMGDQETREILHLIGRLNTRSAFAS
jgi:hypothetical protein